MPPEERRAAIVAAATPLVCDHGATVTTKEIAEAAGIAEGTIFRVFPDKDSVVRAVVEKVLDPGPFVEALRGIDPHRPLEQVLSDAVEAMRQRLASVWRIVWMLRWAGPPGGGAEQSKFAPSARPDMTEANDAVAELLLPHRGRLRLPPIEAARMFRLVTFSTVHPAITDGKPLPTDQIVDLLLHGIGTGSGTAADAAGTSIDRWESAAEQVGVM
jgi:AcrR family transcriptional regulator